MVLLTGGNISCSLTQHKATKGYRTVFCEMATTETRKTLVLCVLASLLKRHAIFDVHICMGTVLPLAPSWWSPVSTKKAAEHLFFSLPPSPFLFSEHRFTHVTGRLAGGAQVFPVVRHLWHQI